MNCRAGFAVVSATALVVVAVVVAMDWSTAAMRDPARTLLLGPRESFVAARGPYPPVFGVWELVLFLGAGTAFVAAGFIAWRARPREWTGPLIIVAGLLWLLGGLRRSSDPALFTIAAVVTNLYLPVLIQVLLGFPTGRLRYRWERWFVGACWVLATVGVTVEWMFFDPRAVATTHPSTSVNLLLVHHDPTIATVVQLTVGGLAAVCGLVVTVVIARRWRVGSPAYRSAFLPLGAAGLVAIVVTVGILASAVRFPGSQNAWLLDLRYPTSAVLPVAVAFGVIRYQLARVAVGSAVTAIGSAPPAGAFVTALRRAVRDPTLALWTYAAEHECFVDAEGRRRALPVPGGPQSATVLERGGVPVGALVFDTALPAADPELLAAVRAAAALALEHDRLRADLQVQLGEVRRSRERLATAADTARRRVERDLHDGAQQRLVAAAILLGRARRAGDITTRDRLLAEGVGELDTALAELREFARGVFPPMLAARGLPAALDSLAQRAVLPVRITGEPASRPPAVIEAAAYFVAAEAVTNATRYADARTIQIRCQTDEDELHLCVVDDGCGGAVVSPGGGLDGLADRVAALGGTFEVHSPPGAGTMLTATFPLRSVTA
ncbi:ATP-binding protein [Nocardia sp. CC201C]|uniref:sensor histidine kinase n=1 Tax=Nocardia sp. CC201C TaxID=3044575 RepID=UPI0024A90AC5|nr:ATP-binding protein [Nocardia sp. CC201C]